MKTKWRLNWFNNVYLDVMNMIDRLLRSVLNTGIIPENILEEFWNTLYEYIQKLSVPIKLITTFKLKIFLLIPFVWKDCPG